jgi:hypothetical protein
MALERDVCTDIRTEQTYIAIQDYNSYYMEEFE